MKKQHAIVSYTHYQMILHIYLQIIIQQKKKQTKQTIATNKKREKIS